MARRLSKRKRPRLEDKPQKERNPIAHRVFDDKTIDVLLHLLNNGVISSLDYPVSSGKESIVFRATTPEGFAAVKIFKYETSAFRRFAEYLEGDPRFTMKPTLRARVQVWAKKEFLNLKTCHGVGVRVPEPFAVRENVVVMEFIGENGVAAPRLEAITLEDPQAVAEDLVFQASKVYREARIVHADLSSFNVLFAEKPVIIDWAQGVSVRHPRAEEFLERDARNVAAFFSRQKVDVDSNAVLSAIRDGQGL
ncbi:serine protein kinase RIO [Candidatus Micrarchaeota archaeon]|nr:serine protein kinase RIO [Candidatus Micrarchaeota archaeon]